MSADNYYTIKKNPTDGLWYIYHGFMSSLEDGWKADHAAAGAFATADEARDYYWEHEAGYWSEYGLIGE